MKRLTNFFLLLTFSILCHGECTAQSPNNSYIIQSSDWLSKVSNTAYGDPHLYHNIITGTNAKAKTDKSFALITTPNSISVGQKIWIPKLDTPTPATANAPQSGILVTIPETNCDIRLWYNYQVVDIGKINERWEQEGIPLETRARKAYNLRHQARINARYMMPNKAEVEVLRQRDQQKYGNPDGPTFEYLLKKNTDKGLSMEAAYQSIIDSSSRTDKGYNADCQ